MLWRLAFLWRLVWGPSRGRIWGRRLRSRRRDGLLYALLNCHATRRTRSGLLPYLAAINQPEEQSDELLA